MNDQWIDVAASGTLPEGDVIGVDVGGKSIALYQIDGEVYATDNICTHGNSRLCDGFLEGHEIECPLHQGKFDIRTGKALCAPLIDDIKTYPVRIEGNRVFVALYIAM
jgi:naphthalene 1,2-dioxygenase system ferredoxin subunit